MNIQYEKPTLGDVESMLALLKDEVEKGVILFRSKDEISTNIRSYTVAKKDNQIVGLLALHIHTTDLCEVRSLMVHEEFRGHKIASTMLLLATEEAVRLGLKKILVLTYVSSIFLKLGFEIIEKEQIPEHKIWTDCIKCKHFPVCNEISLIKNI